jgi:hypothetical protein
LEPLIRANEAHGGNRTAIMRKEDSAMVDLEQQVAGVFSQAVARIMMTLLGIAYFDDEYGTRDTIKKGIVSELANASYATSGHWSLAWGPVTFKGTDNLIYVARFRQSQTYAVVMRGTAPDFDSIIEDIPTSQDDFARYSAPGATVSSEFRHALIGLTMLRDPDLKCNLVDFLSGAIGGAANATIYCTGHSQGGALVPMMMGFLGGPAKSWQAKLLAYSFAGPTSGNPAFANWVDSTGALVRVVNPLDIVPYGYAAIDRIMPDNVPCKVSGWEKSCLEGALSDVSYLLSWTGTWQQPHNPTVLTATHATGTLLDQVGIQHETNSYLALLGATQLDFEPKSPF